MHQLIAVYTQKGFIREDLSEQLLRDPESLWKYVETTIFQIMFARTCTPSFEKLYKVFESLQPRPVFDQNAWEELERQERERVGMESEAIAMREEAKMKNIGNNGGARRQVVKEETGSVLVQVVQESPSVEETPKNIDLERDFDEYVESWTPEMPVLSKK